MRKKEGAEPVPPKATFRKSMEGALRHGKPILGLPELPDDATREQEQTRSVAVVKLLQAVGLRASTSRSNVVRRRAITEEQLLLETAPAPEKKIARMAREIPIRADEKLSEAIQRAASPKGRPRKDAPEPHDERSYRETLRAWIGPEKLRELGRKKGTAQGQKLASRAGAAAMKAKGASTTADLKAAAAAVQRRRPNAARRILVGEVRSELRKQGKRVPVNLSRAMRGVWHPKG